jgi:hypothetical protein
MRISNRNPQSEFAEAKRFLLALNPTGPWTLTAIRPINVIGARRTETQYCTAIDQAMEFVAEHRGGFRDVSPSRCQSFAPDPAIQFTFSPRDSRRILRRDGKDLNDVRADPDAMREKAQAFMRGEMPCPLQYQKDETT